MNRPRQLRGLYAITDTKLATTHGVIQQVEAALLGGAGIIQYRDKSHAHQRRLAETRQLRQLTRQYHALLIINDDVALAREAEADGVHLGKDDWDPRKARQELGGGAIIGVSCYNRLELGRKAKQAGADYIAFGRFFPSQTKPEAVPADAELLRQAKRELDLPLVAIGGITPENGHQLIAAGADMLAVIHAVFGQPDIRQACERFQPIFLPEETSI